MQRAPRFVELDNDDRRWLESSIVEALGLAGRRPRPGIGRSTAICLQTSTLKPYAGSIDACVDPCPPRHALRSDDPASEGRSSAGTGTTASGGAGRLPPPPRSSDGRLAAADASRVRLSTSRHRNVRTKHASTSTFSSCACGSARLMRLFTASPACRSVRRRSSYSTAGRWSRCTVLSIEPVVLESRPYFYIKKTRAAACLRFPSRRRRKHACGGLSSSMTSALTSQGAEFAALQRPERAVRIVARGAIGADSSHAWKHGSRRQAGAGGGEQWRGLRGPMSRRKSTANGAQPRPAS